MLRALRRTSESPTHRAPSRGPKSNEYHMNNDYTFWESSLLARAAGKPAPSIPDINKPEPGYYRMSGGKGKGPIPVAFWYDNGILHCTIRGRSTDDLQACKAWPFAAKNPVDYDVFRQVSAGQPWPDIPDGLTDQAVPTASGSVTTTHNEPPPEHEVLSETVDNAVKAGATFTTVASDAVASQAQSARARLNELAGEAEKKRMTEKAPVIALGKEVDAKWAPPRDKAKGEADRIAKLISGWETKKANDARAAAAAAAAEQAKTVAAAAQAGAPPPPPPAPPPPPPATTIKGGYGRAAGVRVVQTIKSYKIDDLFAMFKTNSDVVALLVKLAQKAVDDGHTVPGVATEEERKVS